MSIITDEQKKQKLREEARKRERARFHTKIREDVEEGKQKTLIPVASCSDELNNKINVPIVDIRNHN